MNIKNNTGKYLLVAVAILLATFTFNAQAENPFENRFTVSADGQEVTDSQTKLIWRRCAEGMKWDGATCDGEPIAVTQEAAIERAREQASSSGLSWYLPDRKELYSIADEFNPLQPVTDYKAFPATPKEGFWCTTRKITVGPGSENALGVSFMNGKIFASPTITRYHARLVRSAQSN